MKYFQKPVKQIYSLGQAISLTLLLFALSWLTLNNSTAESITPQHSSLNSTTPSIISASTELLHKPASKGAVSNPVEPAFINAVPSSDGTEVAVFASGIGQSNTPIILTVGPPGGTGGGHRRSGAMTLSGTTYIANAIGFAPGTDVEDTMNITTTVDNQVMGTGDINFERAFVQTSQPEMIPIDDGLFSVEMPNTGTFPSDAYVMVMSTNMPPGPLPIGYRFASNSYNVAASGSLSESEKIMTFKLRFEEPLPENSDPHTLALLRWDQLNKKWDVLGGDLFDVDNEMVLITQRFGIHTLATTPTWRDSFKEFSLTGVSERENTSWGPGGTIILSAGAASGTVTSIPIVPSASIERWGNLQFEATNSLSTSLTIDILDTNDTLLLANVSDGGDLSTLPVTTSLKLRATLMTTTPGETPQLEAWSIGWLVQASNVYLPLVVKE